MGVKRSIHFWNGVYRPLKELSRRSNVALNKLVNLAVERFVGGCDVHELEVLAEIEHLCREDRFLRRVSSTMLRSGSYLPKYADRLFRAPWDSEGDKTSPFNYPRKGEVPLRALNPKEEEIMRRVLARREAVATRIAELLDMVLPREKFRLAPRRSRSRRRDNIKSVKNVRTDRGDV